MIPQKLQINGMRFVLIEKSGKRPFEKDWQNKNMICNDPILIDHIKNGGNYGVMGGGPRNLLIVDFDSQKVQNEVITMLPETFTVKTGSGMMHKYYFSDKAISFKIFDEDMNTLIDVQGEGKQAVGPGSTHPNGNKYEVIEDKEIAFIEYPELKAIVMKYDKKPKKDVVKNDEKPREFQHNNFLDFVKGQIKIEDVLENLGVDTSRNPSTCPFHNSKGGKCLGWNDETAHCFHCDGSWNIYSLVKQAKNCDFKDALIWLCETFGLTNEYNQNRKDYLDSLNVQEENIKRNLKMEFLELISGKEKKISAATELLVNYILKNNHIYTTKDDIKPEIWIYKDGIYIPQGRSEIKEIMREILEEWYNQFFYNQVVAKIEADTFIDTNKFFKSNYPDEVIVQNGILNIFTRAMSSFTPDKIFFNKLPVTYDSKAKCPTIDLFLDDVLKSNEDKMVFYELAGFALLKEYRFEMAAMFVGNGRNGKGKSLELLKRLVGVDNCASLPLSSLLPDSFTISELFGKLLNLAGDIGNKDLQDTSMFKTLTGRDLVTTKRKFLSGLHFENYAKFIFACNDLPSVYDTSRGFWDRWLLLEFPYTFVTQEEFDKTLEKDRKLLKIKDENIINRIVTPVELSGLLNKALDGLERIDKNHKFSITKGTAEIKELWIRKANSVVAFCFDSVEEDADEHITKKQFRKRYSEYCKKHGVLSKSDFVIKKALQEMFGASDERIMTGKFPDNSFNWVWMGVKWKNSL